MNNVLECSEIYFECDAPRPDISWFINPMNTVAVRCNKCQ